MGFVRRLPVLAVPLALVGAAAAPAMWVWLRIRGGGRSRGFTYVMALIALVIVGILAEVATVTTTRVQQEEREKELLFRGLAYRNAICAYYEAGASLGRAYEYPRRQGISYRTRAFSARGTITCPVSGSDGYRCQALYQEAKSRHPRRWSRHTRHWDPIGVVTLNSEEETLTHAALRPLNEKRKSA